MKITLERCCERLRGFRDVLILAHQNPDGDTLGSSFALHYILRQAGIRSRVVCADGIPAQYGYMLTQYAPEEFEPQNVVAVDVADLQLLGEPLRGYADRVDLCIDHHGSNTFYAKETFLRPEAAATGELLMEILDVLGAALDPCIADCIYTAVATDTGCFRYSNTTGHTHAVAARMFRAGADHARINHVMFEMKSLSRIAIEREVLNTVEYHFDKRCALVWITREMMRRTGALDAELEGVAAMPRQIEGVAAGLTLREREGGYKVSLRTDETIDAAAVCQSLGGGGHPRAAGCFLSGTLEDCKALVLAAVGRVMGARVKAS